MKTLFIVRTKSREQGTVGTAWLDKKNNWVSLELPDLNNLPRVSCIPVGEYKVVWTYSPTFKKYTYQIMNVPKRGGIRIHSGNWAGLAGKYRTHSQGCPLLGIKLGVLKGQIAVLSSRLAVQQFETAMQRKPFLLKVTYA